MATTSRGEARLRRHKGLAMGICLGVALGAAIGKLGIGVAIGVALGLGLDEASHRRKPSGTEGEGDAAR